jgi:hypothetical protein
MRLHVVEANGATAACCLPGGLASGESSAYDLYPSFLIHGEDVMSVKKKVNYAPPAKLSLACMIPWRDDLMLWHSKILLTGSMPGGGH